MIHALAVAAALAAGSPAADNPDMARIFDADQAARKSQPVDWKIVGPQDETRQAQTRRLLDQGVLATGEDFRRAAYVFQHSQRPDDYLLAHTLAVIAVGKGSEKASWIAAATMDRYLQQSGHPQIYGTQYTRPYGADHWSQEPYDRKLVSDPLRRELKVADSAKQAATLAEMNAQAKRRSAKPSDQR